MTISHRHPVLSGICLGVAHREDYPAPHPLELFVEPEDGEDRIVEHSVVEQVIRIV